MNIEKYIGLFLEKNRYCYLPNLGEFAIVKKPALIKDTEIKAPEFEVNFKFSGGLIDDSLANFIAVNERTSIANAANAIRDFSVNTRQTLSDGGTVEIPGFGKFLNNNGKNEFFADPTIKVAPPMSIPNFKNVSQTAVADIKEGPSIAEMHQKMDLKAPGLEDEIVIKPPTVNWGKIIALALIALAILGLIGGGIWYMNKNRADETAIEVEAEQAVPPKDTATVAAMPADSSQGQNPAATVPAVAVSTATSGSVFGILNFTDKASASKKEAQLKSYGHNVAVLDNADGTFTLTITLPEVINAAVAQDSLRRFFNPKGSVTIIK